LAAKNQTKKRQKQLAKQKKNALLKQKKRALVIPTQDVTKMVPAIDLPAMYRAIADRDSRVWDAFLEYMSFFETNHYGQFGVECIKAINTFVQAVYSAMAVEGFNPSGPQAAKMIQMQHVFHHLVASSCYQNNDALLDVNLSMQGNVPRILFLMNPRCEIQLDQSKFFDLDPGLTSLWYQAYMHGLSSPTELIQKNMYRHLECMDERWMPMSHVVSGLYFGCTYHNPDAAPRVKRIINAAVKKRIEGNYPPIINRPDPNSIAIITNKWHRNHAVYKSAGTLVEQLKGKYKLTLVWTGPKNRMPPTLVRDGFDKIVNCHFMPDGQMAIPPEVMENDFQLAYFPDIGMTDESIWMSNMRIAPIQAVGYGHPDTTGEGNEIDYFIGGDVEKHSTSAYSETMVLLPGLAQEPSRPTAERKNNYKDDGVVRVNCVWGPDKYNFSLLQMLKGINIKVEQRAPGTKFEFHFFGSPGMNRYAALPPFARDIRKLLPNVILHTTQEYYDYMENAEMHDFSLNSFPFGCYNVLIESLYMGLPFLTLVGERFYSRAGMWLNEQVGMQQNNFTDVNQLVDKAAWLITEPEALRAQREHLAAVDLEERLFTPKGNHFLEAVEYILANHPFDKTKIIGDGR
jgi:hypothetical protein